jgi:hypothetical protein
MGLDFPIPSTIPCINKRQRTLSFHLKNDAFSFVWKVLFHQNRSMEQLRAISASVALGCKRQMVPIIDLLK